MTRLDVGQALSLAFQHHEAGRSADARALCQRIARQLPTHAGAQYLLGLIALRGEQPRRAVEHLQRAVAATPSALAPNVALARAQTAAGQRPAAIGQYGRVLTLAGGASAEIHGELADVLRREGRIKEAIDHCHLGLRLAPERAALHNTLGSLLTSAGRAAEALVNLRRALDLRPDWPTASFNLGVALRACGRLDEAAGTLRRAIALKPGHSAAHAALAALWHEAKKPDDARRHAERALAFDKGSADAWLVLGQLDLRGAPDKALAAFERAARLAPDLPQAQFCLAEAWRRRGDAGKAARHYRRYLDLEPADRLGATLALATLQGVAAPATAPPEYVRTLFDHYAERFDADLVEALGYQAPQILGGVLAEVIGTPCPRLDIFDIGCGTGLCGHVLRPLARRLDGLDLSPRMVEKAAERGLYDGLTVGDLATAMADRPQAYDLVVAGDVFVYIGDLQPALLATFAALRPGGLLAFTTERGDGDGYTLGDKHRYRHAPRYLEAMARHAGFTVPLLRDCVCRHENRQPVASLVTVLRKAA